ncbi:MAG TPA: nucleotidyltransferase domain-containing protein [bacterium]|jgi:hypothetical protein
MAPQIPLDNERIAQFCQRWGIVELSLFGSVVRPDFRPDSDIDVLVAFAPTVRYGLFALSRMQRELTSILGREADIVERSEVEMSENFIRRNSVLQSVLRVYAA